MILTLHIDDSDTIHPEYINILSVKESKIFPGCVEIIIDHSSMGARVWLPLEKDEFGDQSGPIFGVRLGELVLTTHILTLEPKEPRKRFKDLQLALHGLACSSRCTLSVQQACCIF